MELAFYSHLLGDRQTACKTFDTRSQCCETLIRCIRQETWPRDVMESNSGRGSSGLLHVRESLQ